MSCQTIVVDPNGMRPRVLTINRKLPGPFIQVCKNDVIRVRLQNDLDSMETSLHWHGILQRGFGFSFFFSFWLFEFLLQPLC